jgi:hypothetical protein
VYLSFSDPDVKTQSKMRVPSQFGNEGLPLAAPNKPSPVSSATLGLNRSHFLSSAMNSGSAICAVLPVTTRSRTRSIFARSVIRTRSTPGTAAAAVNAFKSEMLT